MRHHGSDVSSQLGTVQKQAVQEKTFQNSYEVQRKKDGELLQAQLPKDAKFLGGIYKHFPQYDHVEADFVDFELGNFTMPFNFKPNVSHGPRPVRVE
jgi:hypothetical protein